jgi:CheY-like chemotaxis protein
MTPPETTAELLHKLSKELPSKRALLIDRYPNARSSLRIMLASMGVTAVHNAGNSAEVLRQVKAHSFDIILSAYLLEDGRDGQQLLEELRQQHLLPSKHRRLHHHRRTRPTTTLSRSPNWRLTTT